MGLVQARLQLQGRLPHVCRGMDSRPRAAFRRRQAGGGPAVPLDTQRRLRRRTSARAPEPRCRRRLARRPDGEFPAGGTRRQADAGLAEVSLAAAAYLRGGVANATPPFLPTCGTDFAIAPE